MFGPAQRVGVSRTAVVVAGLVLAFLLPQFASAALTEPCGLAAPSASGYFFSSYESVTYTPEGYLELHFRNQSRYSDGRGFSVSWTFLSDECLGQGSGSSGMGMPAGVTDWSVRFTSVSHFDLWDDTTNVIVVSRDIVPAYPNYTRISFRGSIDGGASFVNSRTFKIYQPGLPPEFPNTAVKADACPTITASGYYFDSYEHAEYVEGLLRVHLRFKTPHNDGRTFRLSGIGATDPCLFSVPSYLANPAASVTPRVRYYSFRMTSPTHWVLWDDENDVAFTCANCSGNIPEGSAHVLWYGTIDAGASTMRTAPYPPTLGPPPCAIDCNSNVIFLPGIESSRLYRPDYAGGTDRLWEPGENQDVRDLYLDVNGDGVRDDVYARERDVLDETPIGVNIYKSFIHKMDDLKSTSKINDWEPIAYDWRLSLDDILTHGNNIDGRIYYTGLLSATSSPYILQELRHLAETSRTGKVTIVAHSNGGLLAKRLMQVLGSEAPTLIDRIILVGSPQAGTPMAIAAGLHGYKQEFAYGLILSSNVARTFAQNAPMFYNLLPSADYFTYVDDPVVTFDSTIPEWSDRYQVTEVHSKDRLEAFLTDTYGRVDAETGDTDDPIQMSQSMFDASHTLHTSLDSWTPPNGVEVIQIAGWGVPSTVKGITYTKNGTGIKPQPEFTVDGDGTVVVPSALWTPQGPSVNNYWFDLDAYNENHPITLVFGNLSYNHARIFEAEPTIDFISDLIKQTTKPLPDYVYVSTVAPISNSARLRYSLHSPLSLDMYDNLGRHTGISTTTGQLETAIPGTYYTEFGEAKYIFADADASVHIYMDGYDTGTFTFNVEQLVGDDVNKKVSFKDIPTTQNTLASINVVSDIDSITPLTLDKNGDGTTDFVITPDQTKEVQLPKAPITVRADNKSIQLGAAIPAFTYDISGFIAGETLITSDIKGVPVCTTTATASSPAGAYPITCTVGTLASDYYKFEDFVSGTFSISYPWSGFLQPIDDPIATPGISPSIFKAGSTVPVKFKLKNSGGQVVQATVLPQWLTPTKGAALTGTIDEPVYSDPATTGSTYRWDSTSQQYIYNWSTKGFTPGYWYKIYAKLDDGTIKSVTVGLR